MQVSVHESLSAFGAEEWNALGGDANPCLSHEFLIALERHGCLGERHGWLPRPFAVRAPGGRLLGAAPAYLKYNSYGEFVFDWAWADAYQRHGLEYYPKLIVAVPYTPAPGRRLLVAPGEDFEAVASALQQAVGEYARARNLSGVHWLFTTDEEIDLLSAGGLLRRMGCQYHWHNEGYADFEAFLGRFASRKRKKLRRERRRVAEQGISLRTLHGHELSATEWQVLHDFYLATYERKWGFPTLTLGFFREIGRTLGARVVVVFAYFEGRAVAGALMLAGGGTLYGRVWGCREQFHSLHFETCYYRGIDYCIEHGLERFQPGAQGEHKISRGFRPVPTWSAHWLAEPAFHDAVGRYLAEELPMMREQCEQLHELLPFRRDG